jgi:hypothetical protein
MLMFYDEDLRALLRALEEASQPPLAADQLCRLRASENEEAAAFCTDFIRRSDLLQIAEAWRYLGANAKRRGQGTHLT